MTACELDLNKIEQSDRKQLYFSVLQLSASDGLAVIAARTAEVEQWESKYPQDPLNSILKDYVEVRRKEAMLWTDMGIMPTNA